jgi:single-strand DNA-binding protein
MCAMRINRVVLAGHVSRDAELEVLPTGECVCELRLAVNTFQRGSNGKRREKVHFFNVAVYGAQGQVVAKHVRKGAAVSVDGRLDWREWETSGGRRAEAVRIVAEDVQFLGTRSKDGNDERDPEAPRAGVEGSTENKLTSETAIAWAI